MDKRAFPRVHCEVEGNFKNFARASAPAVNFITTQDLSEGGLRFRTFYFFPVNQPMPFILEIPKSAPVEATAELAWIKELPNLGCYEAGARFVALPDQHKDTLQRFVFEHPPKT